MRKVRQVDRVERFEIMIGNEVWKRDKIRRSYGMNQGIQALWNDTWEMNDVCRVRQRSSQYVVRS